MASDLMKDSVIADMVNELKKLKDEEKFHIICRKMFEEVYSRSVPDLDKFLFDRQYLGFSERQIFPKVREVLHVIDRDDIREVFIVAGKGSGKSVIVGISKLRMLYKVLSFVDPSAYFGLLPGTYIAAVNMSINSSQALNVIFKRFLHYLSRLEGFRKEARQAILKYKKSEIDKEYSHHNFTAKDNLSKYELYAETVGMVTFPNKNIVAISGHSKASAFYGYDVIFGSIDEMSWFETGKERVSDMDELPSEEIYQGLSSSGLSRFPNHYKIVSISSPRARVGDPLWKRYERVKNMGSVFEAL